MSASKEERDGERPGVVAGFILARCLVGGLTLKLEKLIHTLEWVRIEEFVGSTWSGVGRPPHGRGALANAFVAKTVAGVTHDDSDDRAFADRSCFEAYLRLSGVATVAGYCG